MAAIPDKIEQAVRAQLQGEDAEAAGLYRAFADIARHQAEGRYDYGVLLRNLGALEEARDLLIAEVAADPASARARYDLGVTYMSLGDYPAGWPLYEARREIPRFPMHIPQLPFPEWRGEDLAGKRIVIFPEQGLGDMIQFARFALTLRDQGAQVVLLTWQPIAALLRAGLDGVDVQAAAGAVEMGEPDFWIMAGSLPGPMGLTLRDIPGPPYLRAEAPARRGRAFRVGLATKGSPTNQNDAHRSLGPEQAARLRARPAAEIVSLHHEDAGDFVSTANLIAGLDLVISVDTAVAHLAGALGKPVFLLLPGFGTDWRWLRGRDDSPWYPQARLFRGAVDGRWDLALERLEGAVAEMARAWS